MLDLGKLVDLLVEKEFISGQEIADHFGVTRAAIWKQIEVLRQLKYEIAANPRRGYKLLSRPDRLYPWEVGKGLKTKLIGENMEYFDELPSTNQYAKEILGSVPEGTVIIAEKQTAGRGRLGRTWFSPSATGIWISLILRPQLPPAQLPKLTLVAAVALSQTIFEELGVRPLIKWPNDLYLEGRKISGILTELTGEMGRLEHVILGVGINANQKVNDFPVELWDKAGSLAMALGRPVDRQAILRHYLFCFEQLYFHSLQAGFASTLDYCRQFTNTLGREVEVNNGIKILRGRALEITDEGALVIEDEGKKIKVYSGDVNLPNQG